MVVGLSTYTLMYRHHVLQEKYIGTSISFAILYLLWFRGKGYEGTSDATPFCQTLILVLPSREVRTRYTHPKEKPHLEVCDSKGSGLVRQRGCVSGRDLLLSDSFFTGQGTSSGLKRYEYRGS